MKHLSLFLPFFCRRRRIRLFAVLAAIMVTISLTTSAPRALWASPDGVTEAGGLGGAAPKLNNTLILSTELPVISEFSVSAISDDGLLKTTDDKVFRLAGITLPEPLSIAYLERLLAENRCCLAYSAGQDRSASRNKSADQKNKADPLLPDRHGRVPALITLPDDGRWVQALLVREGQAIVSPSPMQEIPGLDDLLALEQLARLAGKGLWQSPRFHPRPAARPQDLATEKWQIVQGEILSVTQKKKFLYLNFGENWKEDFTVGIPAKTVKQFERKGIDLHALKGKTIRVRGWIEDYYGPFIKIENPQQMEILHSPAAPALVFAPGPG